MDLPIEASAVFNFNTPLTQCHTLVTSQLSQGLDASLASSSPGSTLFLKCVPEPHYKQAFGEQIMDDMNKRCHNIL